MKVQNTEMKDRTTVSLPRSLARRTAAEAEASGRSVSAVVREALEAYFAGQESAPLPSFTGVAASGHADTSERVEELIRARLRQRDRA